MDTTAKIKLVIYVDPAMKESLEKLSEKTAAPIAALVRRYIAAGLEKSNKKVAA